jgi:hypothetical protein
MTPSKLGDEARNRQVRRWSAAPWLLVPILVVTVVAATGCNSSDCAGTPQDGAVRVSQQASQRLQVRIDQISSSKAPEFSLEATDEEVTSYLADHLQQSPLTNMQVRFVSNKVQISAIAAQFLSLPVSSVWSAQIISGQVRINLESATVSCMPVPPPLLDSASATLNQMIVESQVNVQVKSIRIDPGKIAVVASKSQ